MSRWLCLFTGAVHESVADAYVRDGFTVILGPDHPGFASVPAIPLAALETDAAVTARRARDLWKEIGDRATATGDTVSRILANDGISLWDVCATNIILYYFQKICRNVSCVDRLLETQSRPDIVIVDDREDLAARWLEHRAAADGIPVERLSQKIERRANAAADGKLHELARRVRNPLYAASARQDRAGNGEVLFLGFVDRQLDAMIPVAEEMRANADMPVRFLLPLSSGRRTELAEKGFAVSAYESFTPSWRVSALPRAVSEAALSAIASDPVCGAYSVELLPRLRQLFERATEFRVLGRALLARLRPSLLVTSDVNHPLLRSLCLDAARTGIPSLNIPYGLVTPQAIEWSLIPQTVAALLGRRSAEAIASFGRVNSLLEVTGSPRHDGWGGSSAGDRNGRGRADLGVTADDRVVCFLSVPADVNRLGSQDGALRDSEKSELLEAVRDAVLRISRGYLLVVAHPEENIKKLESTLGSYDRNRIRILKASSIREILELADVAVTSHSMTGLEAILLGVPLVTVNLGGRADPVPYAEDGGALGVYDAAMLLPALQLALTSANRPANREKFLALHLSQPTEGSARLIADLARGLVLKSVSGEVA